MIPWLEPYHILLIVSGLFFILLQMTVLTVFFVLYFAVPLRASSSQWASAPARKVSPLSPNPMNAPAALPPFLR